MTPHTWGFETGAGGARNPKDPQFVKCSGHNTSPDWILIKSLYVRDKNF